MAEVPHHRDEVKLLRAARAYGETADIVEFQNSGREAVQEHSGTVNAGVDRPSGDERILPDPQADRPRHRIALLPPTFSHRASL